MLGNIHSFIMPGVMHAPLCFSGGKMSEDELNSLIAHAHRRIEQLQRQLAEQHTLERQRGLESLDRQRTEDERLADDHLSFERQQWEEEVNVHRQEWVSLVAAIN